MGGRSLPANHQLIPMQTQTPIADRLKSWRKSALGANLPASLSPKQPAS
jgi:hypothetical protein